MDYQAITLVIRNSVAVITLNRPDMMNALNTQMRAEITHAMKAAEKDARVVVLTGADQDQNGVPEVGLVRRAEQGTHKRDVAPHQATPTSVVMEIDMAVAPHECDK